MTQDKALLLSLPSTWTLTSSPGTLDTLPARSAPLSGCEHTRPWEIFGISPCYLTFSFYVIITETEALLKVQWGINR